MSAPMQITPEAWEAYRNAFRSLGPCHRLVDRWRYDLKWTVPEKLVANWLAPERSKLVEKAGHA